MRQIRTNNFPSNCGVFILHQFPTNYDLDDVALRQGQSPQSALAKAALLLTAAENKAGREDRLQTYGRYPRQLVANLNKGSQSKMITLMKQRGWKPAPSLTYLGASGRPIVWLAKTAPGNRIR